jgi:hypothetical protein
MVLGRQHAQSKYIFQNFLLELQSFLCGDHRVEGIAREMDDGSRNVRLNSAATSYDEVMVGPHGVSPKFGCGAFEECERSSEIS